MFRIDMQFLNELSFISDIELGIITWISDEQTSKQKLFIEWTFDGIDINFNGVQFLKADSSIYLTFESITILEIDEQPLNKLLVYFY